jgi:16S rRNA (guanine527-N7)-methyltransferase
VTDPAEPAPAVARSIFGDRLPLAESYAAWLVGAGVERGLIGPREAPRIWSRHLLNCAVVAELVPSEARVVDVGSGAGLPGIVLACVRPDLRIELVEPLQRRTNFLTEVVAELGLTEQVSIVRGRAEEPTVRAAVGGADVVTARAVAPLDRLMSWCLPLARPEGVVLAMKGERAAAELDENQAAIARAGGTDVRLVTCGAEVVDEPARVVVAYRSNSSGRKAGR